MRVPVFLAGLARGLSRVLLLVGAGGVLAGTLSAWGQMTLLRSIPIALPGALLPGGGLCLAVALLALLGARRWPILCLVGALVVLAQTRQAAHDIPHLLKHQIIGAQLGLFPINRLLDQFHIPDVEVGQWAVPDAQLLGAGLLWSTRGGWLLLAGALLGLPSDPALLWTAARTVRARCRACGAQRLASRPARFCPQCGTLADTRRPPVCPQCSREAAPGDRHCIACGTALGALPRLSSSAQ